MAKVERAMSMDEMVAESRKDGYVVINIGDGPFRLHTLIEFAKNVFPGHTLEQLAIIEADEGQVVVAAELGRSTLPN